MQVTPEHPTVVLIERNLDKARATLIAQVEINIDKNQQERDIVVAEINKLLEELDLLPLFEAEYLRLKRDYLDQILPHATFTMMRITSAMFCDTMKTRLPSKIRSIDRCVAIRV